MQTAVATRVRPASRYRDRPRVVLAAALAAATTGLVHLSLVSTYLTEAVHVGVLFLVGGVLALGAAVRLVGGHEREGWLVGGTVCAGMALGYVLSRTVGLPGFREVGVRQVPGMFSLLLELGFLGLWATATYTARRSLPARFRR